jgi:hypothetical protein
MSICSKTSIIFNYPSKLVGLPPYYYRSRVCNTNLTGNSPADQYQRLKLIQNTVRVPSSLYTSNLGSLSAYKQPTAATQNVCWNQMSDRPVPSVQRATVPTGFANSLNGRHSSVTSSKPGSQTPGGVGCDIKHNSYDRYLNRLKGKGPLKRGIVPPTFGAPIKFNPAFPIYGSKTTKTSIVSGCYAVQGCTKTDYEVKNDINNQNTYIYNDPIWYPYPSGSCSFNVGDSVYAIQTGTNYYSKAIITLDFGNGTYEIQFENGNSQHANISELTIYFPCDCNTPTQSIIINAFATGPECIIPVDSLYRTNVL